MLLLAAPLLAVAVAVAASALVLLATGNSPSKVFWVMAVKGTKTEAVVSMLNRAGPYYISGVAVAIGFKMNLFNIGVEGQYRLAALLAAAAGAAVTLPAPLHVLVILLVAMATGALWAVIPGLLKATRGVSEVISTIMLNAVAGGVTALLLEQYLKAPQEQGGYTVGTRPIGASGRFPSLNAAIAHLGIHLPAANRLQAYIFVAVAVGVAYHLLVWRTRFGFDLRASGSNPSAAEASGVDAKRMIVAAMAISGAFAGLVGLSQVLSEAGRYTSDTVIGGLGFTGIAVALLGRNHPLGIALGALLWAFMDAVQTPLANEGLPKQITAIMQGLIVLSVVVAYEVVRRTAARREASELRRAMPAPEVVRA
ncbi:MAG: sugar transporter permease [Acidimicrobiales bacterium]|nr:sugar transporter permease [Acidimicrobiales bacterium]